VPIPARFSSKPGVFPPVLRANTFFVGPIGPAEEIGILLQLKGICAPLPTPFTDDGLHICQKRLANLLRSQLDSGIRGFVVAGGAGEGASLSPDEHRELVRLVADILPPDAFFLAVVPSSCSLRAAELAGHAVEHGASGIVAAPPAGSSFSDREIREHFRRLSEGAQGTILAVDPETRLDFDLRYEVAGLNGVWIADAALDSPLASAACLTQSTEDEFAFGEMACLPLSLFGWSPGQPPLDPLRELIHVFGCARVAKSAGALGPLRGPLLDLPESGRKTLERAFALAA
jgi:hypothetical protein